MFKKVSGKNGRELWYKDGKLVKWENVPEEIKNPKGNKVHSFAGIEITPEDSDFTVKKIEVKPKEPLKEIKEIVEEKKEEIKEEKPKTCLFCSGHGVRVKSFFEAGAMRTVKLCEDHYWDKSLGEIIKKYRNESQS